MLAVYVPLPLFVVVTSLSSPSDVLYDNLTKASLIVFPVSSVTVII